MELENQVCNLDLAKKLKELEVKQESLLWWGFWHGSTAKGHPSYEGNAEWILRDFKPINYDEYCSAFTVAELGEMLTKHNKCGFDIEYSHSEWNAIWKEWLAVALDCNCEEAHRETAETEANARAKMLIYLLENKLLTLSND